MFDFPSRHRLVVLAVKASASRAKDPVFESRLRHIGSVVGLVGPVSVFCD